MALIANTTALDAWKVITPLARNEFICWVEDAKQETTRERRIRRTQEELEDGQRRPCCWRCKHRERTGRKRPALPTRLHSPEDDGATSAPTTLLMSARHRSSSGSGDDDHAVAPGPKRRLSAVVCQRHGTRWPLVMGPSPLPVMGPP